MGKTDWTKLPIWMYSYSPHKKNWIETKAKRKRRELGDPTYEKNFQIMMEKSANKNIFDARLLKNIWFLRIKQTELTNMRSFSWGFDNMQILTKIQTSLNLKKTVHLKKWPKTATISHILPYFSIIQISTDLYQKNWKQFVIKLPQRYKRLLHSQKRQQIETLSRNRTLN